MSPRRRVADPKCKHVRKGIVKAGDWDGAHASCTVCDRDECIEDAVEWAQMMSGLPAVHLSDADRKRA